MDDKFKFWCLFAEGGVSPGNRFDDKEKAETAAQELCLRQGKTIYVLESISGFEMPKPTINAFATTRSKKDKP